MEATMGTFFDEDWDSLGKIFFTEDAADLMLQFHGDASLFTNGSDDDTTTHVFAAPSIFWPVNGGNCNQNVAAGVDGSTTTLMCSDTFLDYTNNYDFQNISQESSNSSASASASANDGFLPNQSHEFYQANFDVNHLLQLTNDSTDGSMDFCLPDNKNSSFVLPAVMEDIICPREEITMEGNNTGNADSQLQDANNNVANLENEIQQKRKINSTLELQIDVADGQTNIGECSENPKKKKSRVARNAPKTKKNVQLKSKKNKQQKDKQIISNEDDEPNTFQNGQSSTCYSSEDDSNASQESNAGTTSDEKGPALNLNGKIRATRGAATDPQSLYARKRRERINERLRILQNLIPNGTKVDISTMLEEAVHYVKFLQLQIKLLSSDDMWMYAPIVYNGLDIGLFGRIFPTP